MPRVAFSPDGKRIALAGFDGTVRLLDSATGRETLTIYAHSSLVAGVAFSPDGHRLASASYDQTVRIWESMPLVGDPQTPQCITLTEHKQQVSGVAFSPDSCWLASGSWDGTVKLWELSNESGRRTVRSGAAGGLASRYTLRGHTANVIYVAFSPDNQTLASASWDNSVKLWDRLAPEGDSLAERATIPRADRLTSIAFSRDGQMLAIGQQNGIAIFDPNTLKEIHPFKSTPAPVPGLAFGPDGRLFSAGVSDPAIKVWDVASEKSIFELRHYSNPNSTVAVSRDGQLIASAGRDQTAHVVKIWNAQSRKEVRSLKGHAGYVWKVAFSPTGRYLASGSWDSTVKVWDLDAPDSAEPITLRGHAGFIQSLAFSPDGRCLASASGYAGHGEVKLWDASLWENASVKTGVVSNTPAPGITNVPFHSIAKTARFYTRRAARGDRDHRRAGCSVVARHSSGAGSGPPRSCLNNIKQLALASLNYHDANKKFPTGARLPIDVSGRPTGGTNLWVELLPYFEEDSLFKNWDFNDNRNNVAGGTNAIQAKSS